MKSYQLSLTGKVTDQMSLEEVATRLSTLLDVSPAQAKEMIRLQNVIKTNLTEDDGKAYLKDVSNAGAECVLSSVDSRQTVSASVVADKSAPPAAALTGFDIAIKRIKSPVAVAIALLAAILFGLYYPQGSKSFLVIGTIYLDLLKMVLLPFVVASITLGVGKLASIDKGPERIRKIVYVFIGLTIVSVLVAGLTAKLLPPAGQMTNERMVGFGKIVNQGGTEKSGEIEISMRGDSNKVASKEASPALAVAEKLIPGNIFKALSSGDTIKVLVFSIFFGMALSRADKNRGLFSGLLRTVELACMTLMGWFNVLLPFALFVMVYDLIATSGVEIFVLMSSFLITLMSASVMFGLFAAGVIFLAVNRSSALALNILKTPLIIGAATQNALMTIPAAVDAFSDKKTRVTDSEIIYPLGISLCRFGSNIFYVVAVVFVAQLYSRELGAMDWALLLGSAMLGGLASSGASGPLIVSMIALVCAPLRLPVEAAVVLFLAVEPISDVFRTLLNVVGNLAATAWSGSHPEVAEGVDVEVPEFHDRRKSV